ncbi:MAG: MBL fold metallo-hydrolase [Angelakisella sp.]|jgi:hydroxyacylglutathione hydrolase|nr:MBL fold metallo-hydrolase [Angelakisella sp.]
MTITELHAKHTFAANCYVVQSREGNAFLVDPGAEAQGIIDYLREHQVVPKMILLTHGHFDHIGAVKDLQKEYPGLPVYIAQADQELLEGDDKTGALGRRFIRNRDPYIFPVDGFLQEGKDLALDELTVQVMATPGHTKGSVCLFCGSTIFSGDTLFLHDCGRTDLYGGSFPEICDSLRKLAALSGDYTVRPGHGELTSIDEERGWIAALLEKYT